MLDFLGNVLEEKPTIETMNRRDKKNAIRVLKDAIWTLNRGWCQGASAKDKDGNDVCPRTIKAVSHCATGSINANTRSFRLGNLCQNVLDDEVRSLRTKKDYDGIVGYNDHSGQKRYRVVRIFERAIKKLKQSLKTK